MKKILFFVIIYIYTIQNSYSQQRTIITGTVGNVQDSTVKIDLQIIDGAFVTRQEQNYSLNTKDGKFKFDFKLKKTSTATLFINGEIAFLPGTFKVLINPGDNLTFEIPNIKKLGLLNVNISGKGAEKLWIMKETFQNMFATGLTQKPWNKQSITEKYLKLDKYLHIIDSTFNDNELKRSRDMKLVRAQMIDESMDMTLHHSLRYYTDSVSILFKKYIKDKNRIRPFLNEETIDYFGGNYILPKYILLANMDKMKGAPFSFRDNYPLEYSDFVLKEFDSVPFVRDYLLSYLAMDLFGTRWDSRISKQMYSLYVAKVDNRNVHYQEVANEFEHVNNYLKSGSAFYSFSLPDTTGKVHKLADFKGKVVVLDFWFTGCSGCKTIAPLITKVEDSFKDLNVQFISINVDTKSIWKLGIGEYSSKNSLQLYTEEQRFKHPLIKFAKISFYPRLIVLDKQGNIAGIPPSPYDDLDGFADFIKKLL